MRRSPFDIKNGLWLKSLMFSSETNIIHGQIFWHLLSEQDKYKYRCLQLALTEGIEKNTKNQRITSFKKAIEAIKAYAVRGDYNDIARCYTCGLIWLKEGLAVNTYHLKQLMGKCKSSINGSIQKMGYNNNMSRADSAKTMIQWFPMLKDNSTELRKWSIRRIGSSPRKNTNAESTSTESIEAIETYDFESFGDPFEFDGQQDLFYNTN